MEVLKYRVDGTSEWKDIIGLQGKQGPIGPQGIPGEDGYTPVRGTDYWTPADISTIEGYCNSYIDSQLGTINEQLASLTEVE